MIALSIGSLKVRGCGAIIYGDIRGDFVQKMLSYGGEEKRSVYVSNHALPFNELIYIPGAR